MYIILDLFYKIGNVAIIDSRTLTPYAQQSWRCIWESLHLFYSAVVPFARPVTSRTRMHRQSFSDWSVPCSDCSGSRFRLLLTFSDCSVPFPIALTVVSDCSVPLSDCSVPFFDCSVPVFLIAKQFFFRLLQQSFLFAEKNILYANTRKSNYIAPSQINNS